MGKKKKKSLFTLQSSLSTTKNTIQQSLHLGSSLSNITQLIKTKQTNPERLGLTRLSQKEPKTTSNPVALLSESLDNSSGVFDVVDKDGGGLVSRGRDAVLRGGEYFFLFFSFLFFSFPFLTSSSPWTPTSS